MCARFILFQCPHVAVVDDWLYDLSMIVRRSLFAMCAGRLHCGAIYFMADICPLRAVYSM